MKTEETNRPTLYIGNTILRPIPCYWRYVPVFPFHWNHISAPVQIKEEPHIKKEELDSPSNSESAPTSAVKDPIMEKLDGIMASVRRVSRKPIRKEKEFGPRKFRERKTKLQLDILEEEIDFQGNFDKEKLNVIAEKTGLRKSQVYKWYWDHKKKIKD